MLSYTTRDLRNTVLVSLATCGVVLYAFEFYLWAIEDKAGVRGSFYESQRLRERGEKVLPLLLPTQFARLHPTEQFLPLSGPSGVWMLGVNESGNWPKFKTDEFGFNNPPGAPSTTPDLLLVGDSMTQGVNVPSSENVAGHLASNGWRVINLGQGGSGPVVELAIFRKYGLRLRSKHVVWLFYAGNDFTDLDFELKANAYAMRSRNTDDQDVTELRDHTDQLWERFMNASVGEARKLQVKNFLRFLRFARTRTMILTAAAAHPQPQRVSQEQLALLTPIIARAKIEAESAGSTFLFVYLPETGFAGQNSGVYNENKKVVEKAILASNISILDFSRDIERYPDPESLYSQGRYGGHYSPGGYKLLAQSIAAAVSGSVSARN